VCALIMEAAAVEENGHQSDAQRVRERNADDQGYDTAGAETGKSAENIGPGNRQDGKQKRTGDDLRQAQWRRLCWCHAGIGFIWRNV